MIVCFKDLRLHEHVCMEDSFLQFSVWGMHAHIGEIPFAVN